MKFIVFDVETVGIRDEAIALAEPYKNYDPLPPFDPKAVPVGNLKDPDKIAAKIRKVEEAYPETVKKHEEAYEKAKSEYEAKIVSSAAQNALCGRVVAIGINDGENENILSGNEAEILKQFWGSFTATNLPFVGFNCNGLDIPFIVRRSWKLGVVVPNVFNGRFLDKRFIDLVEVFGCGVWGYKVTLANLAKFFETQGKFEGDCTKETFAQNFESTDPIAKQNAVAYLKCNLRAIWAIAEKLLTVPKTEVKKDENPFG